MSGLINQDAKSKRNAKRQDSKEDLFNEPGSVIFRDQIGREWIWIPYKVTGYQKKQLLIGTKEFRRYFNREQKKAGKAVLSNKDLQQHIDELIASIPDDQTIAISPRFHAEKGEVFIDLANAKNEMVQLDSSGWKVLPIHRPLFDRPQGMEALPTPVRGGDIWELFAYLNIVDDEAKLLVVVWLVAALDESIAKMMLVFVGPAGSGKSQVCRFLRSLIDPHVALTNGNSRGDSWHLIMQNNAVVGFDNVGEISRSDENRYCRAITGDAIQERRRFTDSEQVFYKFRRPILINGVHNPVTKTDLMDRSILIEMSRVGSFAPTEDIEQRFQEAHPRLLGALLDLAVKARQQKLPDGCTSEFRMASFARIGRVVSLALGLSDDAFDAALKRNQGMSAMDIVEETSLGYWIIQFAKRFERGDPWEDSVSQLIEELFKMDGSKSLKKKLSPNMAHVSKQLNELVESLKNHGVFVQRLPRKSGKRPWKIFCDESFVLSDAKSSNDEFYSGLCDEDADNDTGNTE